MRPEQKAAESLQRGTLCDEEPKEYVSRVATIIRRANAEHYGVLLKNARLAMNICIPKHSCHSLDVLSRIDAELAALEGK